MIKEKILFIAANTRSLIANRADLIRQMIKNGHEVHALVPEYDFLKEIETLNINYDIIDFNRTGLNPIKDYRTFEELKRIISRIKPDVVFSYSIKPVIYGTLAAKSCKVPVKAAMITGMGYLFTGNSLKQIIFRKIASMLYKRSLQSAETIFFQNPDDLELFRELKIISGTQNEKVHLVNGSGVNLDHFFRAELPLNEVRFLLIARLLKDKGVREFVEACRILKAKYPQAVFRVVGPHDPNLPHSLSLEQIEEWKQEGIVEFVGGVKDVRPYIQESSVYVLPSYREGTPRSVLESMAMGRAIITTDAPGCRETVVDGVNGFLVPVKDRLELANAMERFMISPFLISKMGEKSYKMAKMKYDVNVVNTQILRALQL